MHGLPSTFMQRRSSRLEKRSTKFEVTNLEGSSERRERARHPATEKERVMTSSHYEYRDPIDPTIDFLYRPHSLASLMLLIFGLIFCALNYTSSTDSTGNAFRYYERFNYLSFP